MQKGVVAISIAIGILCLIYPLVFYNFDDLRAGDLAEYINNPLRVLDGQQPYQDFWLIFPPLEVYYPAFLYMLFGVKMFVLFASAWLFGAGAAIMAFLIALRLTNSKYWSVLTAAVFFLSGFISNYSGFDYGGHIHLFFLLLGTYMFISSEKHGNTKLLLIGFIIGVAAGFRIDLSGAYFLALMATLIYMKRRKSIDSADLKRYAVQIIIGCIIAFTIIYLPLVDIFPKTLVETVIKPPVHATVERVGPFETTIGLFRQLPDGGLLSQAMTAFRIIYDIVYKLLPFATLALFIVFMRRGDKDLKMPITLLMLWALFTLPKSLAVIDVHYLSSLNGILILPFMILFKNEILNKNSSRTIRWIGIFAIAILLVSVPSSRGIDFLRFSQQPTYVVQGEVDSLLVKDAETAKHLQGVVDSIQHYTSKGDNIFVAPFFSPPFYEMTGRKNPSYYDSVIDLAFLPDENKQKVICTALDTQDVSLVVYGRDCQMHWNGRCMSEGFKILDECIARNYRKEADYGQFSIYLRK